MTPYALIPARRVSCSAISHVGVPLCDPTLLTPPHRNLRCRSPVDIRAIYHRSMLTQFDPEHPFSIGALVRGELQQKGSTLVRGWAQVRGDIRSPRLMPPLFACACTVALTLALCIGPGALPSLAHGLR